MSVRRRDQNPRVTQSQTDLQPFLTFFAVGALLCTVITLVVRFLPLSSLLALVTAATSPYVPLGVLAVLILAALSRRKVLTIVAVTILAISIAVQVPSYWFGRPDVVGQHTDLRVLSSNLRKGQANPSFFVTLAKDNADVITVSELTPEEVERLNRSGLDAAFPYSLLNPAPGAGGIGLWSRYPITPVPPSRHRISIAAARLDVPGVRVDPAIASIHIMSPLANGRNTFRHWNTGITDTKAKLADLAKTADPGAVIIAGDFNSTIDMHQFRDLLTNGYQDAVQQTGAGFAPTYSPHPRIPPLLAIDHVLTRNAPASSIHTVSIPGSDHRALLATIKVPLDPTGS